MSDSESATRVPAWVAVMAVGLLTGLQPLTTDMYLPALPQLQQSLGMTPSSAQWTLSLLILTFGIGQLIWGPIADRVGRKPVLRWGLSCFVMASVAAVTAPHAVMMLIARAAQGVCLSAAVVCGRAMVRDLYPPEDGARVMARGMSVLGILALVGPIIGGISATYGGWRVTLGILLLSSLLILGFVWRFLPETLPEDRRQTRLHWGQLITQWWGISKHATFRAHVMLTSSTYGGLYVYLALSAFVFIDILHQSRTWYGLATASLSFWYVLGTLYCRKVLPRQGLLGTVRVAGISSALGGVWMVGTAIWQAVASEPISPYALLPGVWFYAFGHGIHQPCGQTGVVAAFPRQAGAASALSGCILACVAFLVGALMSWWTAQPGWAGTLYPMALGVAIGGGITAWTALRRVQRDGLPRGEAAHG